MLKCIDMQNLIIIYCTVLESCSTGRNDTQRNRVTILRASGFTKHVVRCSCDCHFNPFKTNGLAYPYQLDHSISVSMVVGCYFHFYPNFDRIFSKQTEETLIRRRVLRRLISVCTVCLCPTKKGTRLIWVNSYLNDETIRGPGEAPTERPNVHIYESLSKLLH